MAPRAQQRLGATPVRAALPPMGHRRRAFPARRLLCGPCGVRGRTAVASALKKPTRCSRAAARSTASGVAERRLRVAAGVIDAHGLASHLDCLRVVDLGLRGREALPPGSLLSSLRAVGRKSRTARGAVGFKY
eukprot:366026-Chlamydomonas_euryale.AAC.18